MQSTAPIAVPSSANTGDQLGVPPAFVDRRRAQELATPSFDRRQFANSHSELSPPARELALAIDGYKLQHRRRFITYEEMFHIIQGLGYRKDPATQAG